MYTQFKVLTFEKSIPREAVDLMRKGFKGQPLAVGVCKQDSAKMAIALLDLPKVPWYEAGSPILCFMQNEVWDRPGLKDALKKTMDKVGPMLHGQWHIENLGVDDSNLDSKNAEYDWGPDERKVHAFQKRVAKGAFIDQSGIPCDTCVDEQQFYGCPNCDWNVGAQENEYEQEEWEPEDY